MIAPPGVASSSALNTHLPPSPFPSTSSPMADDSSRPPSKMAGSVMPFDPNLVLAQTDDRLASDRSEIDQDLDGFEASADQDAQLMTAEAIQERVASSRRSTVPYDADALPAYRCVSNC